jgi:hypothetical protein
MVGAGRKERFGCPVLTRCIRFCPCAPGSVARECSAQKRPTRQEGESNPATQSVRRSQSCSSPSRSGPTDSRESATSEGICSASSLSFCARSAGSHRSGSTSRSSSRIAEIPLLQPRASMAAGASVADPSSVNTAFLNAALSGLRCACGSSTTSSLVRSSRRRALRSSSGVSSRARIRAMAPVFVCHGRIRDTGGCFAFATLRRPLAGARPTSGVLNVRGSEEADTTHTRAATTLLREETDTVMLGALPRAPGSHTSPDPTVAAGPAPPVYLERKL